MKAKSDLPKRSNNKEGSRSRKLGKERRNQSLVKPCAKEREREKCGLARDAAQFYGNSRTRSLPLYYTFSGAP